MSVRLELTKLFMRRVLRPHLRRTSDPKRARWGFALAAEHLFLAPPFAWYRDVVLVDGLPTLWVETRPASRPAPSDKVILYLHGGGFVVGAPQTHRKLMARLSWLTGLKICAPQYRLAPEHPFPAGVEDCVAAYAALLDTGYKSENIILGGDSAGGGLCFSVLGAIQGRFPPPRAVFTFSPIVDLRYVSPSFEENNGRDPIFPSERRGLLNELYLGGASPEDPRASPILFEFKDPPPAFFQYAETEILRDESRRMAAHLRAAGGEVELDEWEDAPHVWVLLDRRVPEARVALKRTADFITRQFRDETPAGS